MSDFPGLGKGVWAEVVFRGSFLGFSWEGWYGGIGGMVSRVRGVISLIIGFVGLRAGEAPGCLSELLLLA